MRTPTRALALALGATLVIPLVGAPATAAEDEVFLDSTIGIDTENGSITLPLYEGRHDGATVWYVVTESSNPGDAQQRGVNHSKSLRNALGTAAVQSAPEVDGLLHFEGTVDFAPERIVVPGEEPNPFPPTFVQAGAVGDADYSPLVTPDGRTVLNATQVANGSGVHDAILDGGSIDFDARTVTLDTLDGFYEGNRVQYLHQDASVELVAALEGSTWAPNLDAAPGLATLDPKTSARAAIIPVVNGPREGDGAEQRQGLNSALAGEGDPLNVTQVIPGEKDYTPIWDVTPVVWTDEAIESGQRVRLEDHEDIAALFEAGLLTSGGEGPPNEGLGGARALPGISNCPIVIEFAA